MTDIDDTGVRYAVYCIITVIYRYRGIFLKPGKPRSPVGKRRALGPLTGTSGDSHRGSSTPRCSLLLFNVGVVDVIVVITNCLKMH